MRLAMPWSVCGVCVWQLWLTTFLVGGVVQSDLLEKGTVVRVFYSSTKLDDGENRAYVALQSRYEGIWTPRVGLSEGWLLAEVLQDVDLSTKKDSELCVKVQPLHRWWVSKTGHEPRKRLQGVYAPRDVVRLTAPLPPQSSLLPSVPEPTPQLGLLVFRWGGANQVPNPDQWGAFGNTAHPSYLKGLIDFGLDALLPHQYEIWTIYVHTGADLDRLTGTPTAFAHHPIRRCRHVAAMFFLFPTMYRERSEVHLLRGNDGAALVYQSSLYRAMERLEAYGIPTKFPHSPNLYYILAGKSWLHHMSLSNDWAVTPSVAVPRGLVEVDREKAARSAITMLKRVQEMRGMQVDAAQGVVKLGFSWEALDVAPWKGEAQLAKTLTDFIHSYEIEGDLTTLSHDTPSLLVQPYVRHRIEMRLYVIRGVVEKVMYTKMKDSGEGTFDSFVMKDRVDKTVRKWMGGDLEALSDAEQQAKQFIQRWMLWLEAQTCSPIAAVRFDWYVDIASPGKARLLLGEITENGFSMLGDSGGLGQKVFTAIVQDALGELNFSTSSTLGPDRTGSDEL